MAEEIIDLRDRIEQMRIQIENEAVEQTAQDKPMEIHQQTNNSNISLSMQSNKNYANQNNNNKFDPKDSFNSDKEINNSRLRKEPFPAVSLSVKNPVSSKVLIFMVTLQILSNIGILYFLYLGME